jgi:ParB family chromosome partitioning protein
MDETTAAPAPTLVQQIPVDQIRPSSHQARKNFDQEALKGLAQSMKEEGLLQAITVRRVPRAEGQAQSNDSELGPRASALYELVSGERRLRAAKLLGWPAIDTKIIQTVSEAEAAAKGLVENLQREDLNPIEEAQGLADLNRLDGTYWTQVKIAEVTGKSQSHVSETIRLLDLPDEIKENIRIRIISPDNAAELVRLPNQDLQRKVAEQIIQKGLNSKETRALASKLLKVAKPKKAGRPSLDLLASIWPPLVANTKVKACGYWDVAYKKDKWSFTIGAEAVGSPEDIRQWLRQVADAIPNTPS